jgi:catechol 2,3-dioxygenase-like lactoylglutathione lyase family enzyme
MRGSPLESVVIGSADLEASFRFYRDYLGLESTEIERWADGSIAEYLHLPVDSTARAAGCEFSGSPVGKVLLVEWAGLERRPVRSPAQRRHTGLWNLNFYTLDIEGAASEAAALGYTPWSAPTKHDLTAETGSPVEMILEGPDGVAVNLVQLPATEGTRVGEMRRFLEERGTTARGFTEVVTTAHVVRDRGSALDFHRRVLGMEVLIDEVLGSSQASRFLDLPDHARNHITFVKGDHMFGKVVLTEPLNYEVPDVVPRAVPPNIGYLWQVFEVDDLDRAEAECGSLGVEVWSHRSRVSIPLLGDRERMMVRCPGSGALIEIASSAR